MIRIILIACLLITAVLYFKAFRTRATDRALTIAVFALFVLFILLPDTTTVIAHAVGVGRGADLIFYLFIMACSFFVVLLYGRLLTLETKLTALVREIAIKDVEPPQ